MERNCQLSSSPAKPSLRNSGDRMGNARFHTKTQMPYLFLAISHKKTTSFLKNVFWSNSNKHYQQKLVGFLKSHNNDKIMQIILLQYLKIFFVTL